MMTEEKKQTAAAAVGLARARRQRIEARAPEAPVADSNLGGKLTADDKEDLFWEARVADWLGLPRKRIVALRRRALREGQHWVVYEGQVVFTARGLQLLRDYLSQLGELAKPGEAPDAAPGPAPAGPPQRESVRVVRTFPNARLMQAKRKDGSLVLVRVRDNTNFMAGMAVPVVHDATLNAWQYVGRLPRRKGRL